MTTIYDSHLALCPRRLQNNEYAWATSFVSINIPPIPLIRHGLGIPKRLSPSTTRTRIFSHRQYRIRRHTTHDSRRMVQLCALLAHGVSDCISCSDPQYTFIIPRIHLMQLWYSAATLLTTRTQPSHIRYVLVRHGANRSFDHTYYFAQSLISVMTYKL